MFVCVCTRVCMSAHVYMLECDMCEFVLVKKLFKKSTRACLHA